MKWNRGTRLALLAALDMAAAGDGLVTVAGAAAKHGVSAHHLAKVFQRLARAGIAEAVLGVGGGYRLARSPREVSLFDVIETIEGPAAADTSGSASDATASRLNRVLSEIERQASATLRSTRLAALV